VTSTRARVLCPAKINPYLAVLGKRADGYHELQTWMLCVDWCDELTVERTRSGAVTLALSGPAASADIPSDEHNLAVRAAAHVLAAAREAGRADASTGLALVLEKHIPSRAGLGGASSNAAGAWIAATRVLGGDEWAGPAPAALAQLGSDCAFFTEAAASGAAVCTGRGEIVHALAPPRSWFCVVLTPEFGCSTADVYRAVRAAGEAPIDLVTAVERWSQLAVPDLRRVFRNDLELAAVEAVPALARVRDELRRWDCSHFGLSGSGSSFFGIFPSEATAIGAAEGLRGRIPLRGSRVVRLAGHGAKLLQEI
jgi:4-diphosphocytidyl-2-C-methyl-D-erythritol kinase